MYNISFIELKKANDNNKKGFSFLTNDVTFDILKGRYSLNSKYSIIYLYDVYNDDLSYNFLNIYGGKLHNESSLFITILTYFTEPMIKRWENVQYRNIIEPSEEREVKVINNINKLREIYKVKNLPALIVVKQDEDNEESFVIDLSNYKNADGLYKTFSETINIVNNNCEEEFDKIAIKLNGISVSKNNNFSNINLSNYIYDLVKSESRNRRSHYTQEDLAEDLGICVRTLSNKRSENSFTRDECLYMGLKFGIDIPELNILLDINNHLRLGLSSRDGIIRKCLFNKCDPYETDEILKKEGYHKLLNE